MTSSSRSSSQRYYRRLATTLWLSSSSSSAAAFTSSSGASASLFRTTTTSTPPRTSSSLVPFSFLTSSSRRHRSVLTVTPPPPPSSSCVPKHSFQRLRMSTSTAATTSSSNNNEKVVRVALCQFQVTEDKAVNHATATSFIQKAQEQGAQLVVLPEIWNSPYATLAFPEYAEALPHVGDTHDDIMSSSGKSPTAQLLSSMARQGNIWLVGGSIPEVVEAGDDGDDDKARNNHYYNTCLVLDPTGTVVAKHRKVHLFDIDVPGKITFQESATLSPGNKLTYFETPWCNIGIGICYDIRFPEYAMLLTQDKTKQCRILIYPGAFNLTTGPLHWELLQRARAVDNQCWVLTASPARSSSSSSSSSSDTSSTSKYPPYAAWGHSSAVSPWGHVVATTDEKEDVVMVDVDLEQVEDMRRSIPTLSQKRHDLYRLEEEQV